MDLICGVEVARHKCECPGLKLQLWDCDAFPLNLPFTFTQLAFAFEKESFAMSSTSTALALPGQFPSTAVVAITGRNKLEPRFLSILTSARVPEAQMDLLGDGDFDTAAIFANVARNDAAFESFCKDVLNVDPAVRPADFLLRARLTTAWESCKTRSAVETRAEAERAAQQLPPQIAIGDLEGYQSQLPPPLRTANSLTVNRIRPSPRLARPQRTVRSYGVRFAPSKKGIWKIS